MNEIDDIGVALDHVARGARGQRRVSTPRRVSSVFTASASILSGSGYYEISMAGWTQQNMGSVSVSPNGRLFFPRPFCALFYVQIDIPASASNSNTLNLAISRMQPTPVLDRFLLSFSRPYQHRMLAGGAAILNSEESGNEVALRGYCAGVSGLFNIVCIVRWVILG